MNAAITKGIEFLLQEQKADFYESNHEFTFPRPGIFNIPVFETHRTNLFQRAIAVEALLCARSHGFVIPANIIQEETDHIVKSKHPFVRGGWSYIPHLPDFPPDLDDLGAILQVAAKVNSETLHAICDDSIRLVFKSCINADGSIPTWIADADDQSPAAISIKKCIDIIGGLGTHIDVIANFVEGMLEYDTAGLYSQQLCNTVKYLCNLQQPDGSWPAKWYWGNFYGTYRVVNVLHKAGVESSFITKAHHFIIAHQHQDGSWGNVADTSFALLCLLTTAAKEYNIEIDKGLQWLSGNQLHTGSWPASPFIKMETRNGILSYGSQTVSTAFAVKALLKASAAN